MTQQGDDFTEDQLKEAFDFYLKRMELCLIRVAFWDHASGQHISPDILSLVGTWLNDFRFMCVAIHVCTDGNAILCTALDAEKLLKFVRKSNRGSGPYTVEIEIHPISSDKALVFYQTAPIATPALIRIALDGVKKERDRLLRWSQINAATRRTSCPDDRNSTSAGWLM